MGNNGQLWVVYDSRAVAGGDTDDAIVLSSARSLKEARRDAREAGMPCAIWVYDIEPDGKTLAR